MKISDAILPQGQPPELLDLLNQIIALLNNGRYQLRVIKEAPTFENSEGEMLIQVPADGSSKKLWFFAGDIWNSITFGASGSTNLLDLGDVEADDIEEGQTLQWNGSAFVPVTQGSLRNTYYYGSNDTWTKPTGLAFVIVEVVGGGGSGGANSSGSGSGGGGGGYSRKKISAGSLSATEAITVGSSGGTSSFGSHLQATGGSAGTGGSSQEGGAGGVGSNGDINLQGMQGHYSVATHVPVAGGGAAAGPYGVGQSFRIVNGGLPLDGFPFGGGGSGGGGASGGTGASGLVVVYEYF